MVPCRQALARISFDIDGDIDLKPHLLQRDQNNNKNTIADNFITALREDNNGRLWLGTFAGGVNIVDPERYGEPGAVIKYQHDNNNVNSLVHNGIASFYLEEDGSMMIGTFDGLDRIYKTDPSHDNVQFEHLLPQCIL